MTAFTYENFDRQLWEQELENFVPATVYDMHTHMWSEDHRGSLTGAPTGLREEIDFQDHLDWAAKLYPGRAFHMLVLGTPMPGMDAAGHNALDGGPTRSRPRIRDQHDGHPGHDARIRSRPSR